MLISFLKILFVFFVSFWVVIGSFTIGDGNFYAKEVYSTTIFLSVFLFHTFLLYKEKNSTYSKFLNKLEVVVVEFLLLWISIYIGTNFWIISIQIGSIAYLLGITSLYVWGVFLKNLFILLSLFIFQYSLYTFCPNFSFQEKSLFFHAFLTIISILFCYQVVHLSKIKPHLPYFLLFLCSIGSIHFLIAGFLFIYGKDIWSFSVFQISFIVTVLFSLLYYFFWNLFFRILVITALIFWYGSGRYFFNHIIEPSNNRPFLLSTINPPIISFSQEKVYIQNIRNYTHTTSDLFIPSWYNNSYNLNEVESVDFFTNPFTLNNNLAHVFVSFWFKNGQYLVISIEWRRITTTRGGWDVFRFTFRQLEKMYSIVDERDTLIVRSVISNNPLYRYPINISKNEAKRLLISLLFDAEQLRKNPKFIGTEMTCSHNLFLHMKEIFPQIPINFRVFFWWWVEEVLYEQWFFSLSPGKTLQKLQEEQFMNEKIWKFRYDKEFSKKIRE